MATYNRPGVYVNELPLAAAPVNSAAAATAAGAVIGAFAQGPDDVTLVTSWYQFVKTFGGYNKAYPASFQVGSFFNNGGTELYVKRILPSSAKKVAKVAIPSAPVTHTVALASFGISSNVVTLTTNGAHGITSNSQSITIAGITGDNSFLNGTYTISGSTSTTVTFALTHTNVNSGTSVSGNLTYSASANSAFVTFAAKHRGIDGNNIRVVITNSTAVRESGYYDITVLYEAGVADTITNGIVSANGDDDTVVETFSGVVFDDPLSGDYVVSVLEFNSAYIKALSGAVVEYNADGTVVDPEVTYTVGGSGQTPTIGVIFPLSGAPSPEVNLTYADYTGNTVYDPAGPTGSFSVDDCSVFSEFESINRPLVFFVPDVITKIAATSSSSTYPGWALAKYVYDALVTWVEAPKTNGMHFVVIETAAGLTVDGALTASGDIVPNSSRAAVYFPHFYIKDPVGRSGQAVRQIGPSGAVVGKFLATDAAVGPFKAPAGIQAKIVDALALERPFSPSELDALNTGVSTTGVLNGRNVVNAIRNMPGAGIVVMGGRTLKQDGTANRYINMRRSLIYLEKRLADLASFAVFENNDEKLWARLTTTLGTFLNSYRNQGGLRGTTVDQAYYVKCDAENNTAASIAAGEVHVEIGVALEYPAEFVVINLSQKTSD